MRTLSLTVILLFFFTFLLSQNIIRNADFEHYSDCPDGISQIEKLKDWFLISKSPDFFNCAFDRTPLDKTSSSIFSGNGSIGLLSHYDGVNSFSEAIGQKLTYPLLPNQLYRLSFMVKKVKTGNYSNSCRELEIYGFKNEFNSGTNFTHLSEKKSSIYLGQSNVVDNNDWKIQSISFKPNDTISTLALSLNKGQCNQYVMVDYLSLSSLEVKGNNLKNECVIFPNPVTIFDNIELVCIDRIQYFEVFDSKGVFIKKYIVKNSSTNFSIESQGIYMLRIKTDYCSYVKKLVVLMN